MEKNCDLNIPEEFENFKILKSFWMEYKCSQRTQVVLILSNNCGHCVAYNDHRVFFILTLWKGQIL